jgi:hypothetical protein
MVRKNILLLSENEMKLRNKIHGENIEVLKRLSEVK